MAPRLQSEPARRQLIPMFPPKGFSSSPPFQSSKEALSDINATGVAMLFSAGTFLYVATVHVLPEVGGGGHGHAAAGGSGSKGLSKVEVLALVLGCLIPLVLSVGHRH